MTSSASPSGKKSTRLKRLTASWSRWLHIYLSMASFVILLFFAATGITLNHTEWFEKQQHTSSLKDSLSTALVNNPDTTKLDRLLIVETLRNKHHITGALSAFSIDPYQCNVSFSGPGYAADIFIDRESGRYDMTELHAGFVGILNDLHKGRDSGKAWSWVIDISALLMIILSLTGLIMLFYLKKKRLAGLFLLVLGGLLSWMIYRIWVP